jgi:hypothetical protein
MDTDEEVRVHAWRKWIVVCRRCGACTNHPECDHRGMDPA